MNNQNNELIDEIPRYDTKGIKIKQNNNRKNCNKNKKLNKDL